MKPQPKRLGRWSCALVAALALPACSVALEATRPDPVDTSVYPIGTARDQVRASLGPPMSIGQQGEYSCDSYKLVTTGPNGWQKAGIAFAEVGVDVLTLGIAEIATTPAELATRNGEHVVSFCYNAQNQLAMRSY